MWQIWLFLEQNECEEISNKFFLQIQKKYINVSKKFNEILGWNIIKDFNKCQD